MRYVYAALMLSFAVIAFYHASQIFHNKTYKNVMWCLFTLLSFASGVWSLGYGVMFLTENEDVYSIFRIVGMLGIIFIMIAGQAIIGIMSGETKKIFTVIFVETIAGAAVIYIIGHPGSYIMTHTPMGIVTEFSSGVISLVYTTYALVIAVIFVVITIFLASDRYSNRIRGVAKALLKYEILIAIGMIVDTILPAIGINFNIPASTLLQFGGLEICKRAVLAFNRNTIDMANMATYITRSIKTPILVFDEHHVLRLANAEAKKFFELTDEELKTERGLEFWKYIFGIDSSELLFNKRESVTLDEVDLVFGRNCRLSIDAIYDSYDDYLGYIMSVTDKTMEVNYLNELNVAKDEAVVTMSAAEAARQEAERLRDEAESANKAKTQFLANMSHEMRTPMNAIIGFSEIALRKDQEISDEVRDNFNDINISAKGLLSIINSILDISKIESGKMEVETVSYRPSEIINEVSTVVGMLANNKDIKLEVNVTENIPERLNGDKDKIREILYNLVNNAVKYTDEGKVSLDVNITKIKEDEVNVIFRVEDTGVGIKEEDIDSIFDSFKRVDLEFNKKTEGTGLGLSIVKGYVDLMGGTITVESTYGKGSVFTVELPQKVEKTTDSSANKSHNVNKKKSFKNIRVLAVDDIEINLKVVRTLCKMYEVKCETVTSGIDAIELVKNNAYDIIFMDQMMPVMDGIEAMKKIRELGMGYEQGGPHKIYALTANNMAGVKEEMLELGFDGFLGKPINLGELEELLEHYTVTSATL